MLLVVQQGKQYYHCMYLIPFATIMYKYNVLAYTS